MKLNSIRIRNYRTIASEQTLDLKGGITLVGPNNSGKTNILNAIRMLFTGHDNIHKYDINNDKTFGEKTGQTSLIGTFSGEREGKDQAIYDQLEELKALLDLSDTDQSDEIHLYLTFSTSSNPSYRFYPNSKRPSDPTTRAACSRKERDLVSKLLSSFVCHYVPSNKSFEQLYQDLLSPFIKSHVSSTLKQQESAINRALRETAENITTTLSECGLPNLSVKFNIPNNSLSDFISGFEFNLLDPSETSIFKKGVGIQSTTILSSFKWITQQELNAGYEVIWLIEEPESFLHPTLNSVCNSIIKQIGANSLVAITTHSLSFVPKDPKHSASITMESGNTHITKFRTYKDSTDAIRKSIGVKFSDFFNFGHYNVLLEGPSDRDYLEWFLDLTKDSEDYKWPTLRSPETCFLDYGGVKFLAGFLRASWEFIKDETCVIPVFDGDSAGEKERRDLQHYFGQKSIQFAPNEDFISVRHGHPIEALFPDEWISEIYNDHRNWFDSFSQDVSGELEAFNLKDSRKSDLSKKLREKAEELEDLSWARRWIDLCNALDRALLKKHESLS